MDAVIAWILTDIVMVQKMNHFDLNNPNALYLQQLPIHLIEKAIDANFIDEPIWPRKEALQVIHALEQLKFAITNVYVYALINSNPMVPSYAVYDWEIEEFPLDCSWHEIVKKSSDTALRFIEKFQFLASDTFYGQKSAFSCWAFNEEAYRRFQMSGDSTANTQT